MSHMHLSLSLSQRLCCGLLRITWPGSVLLALTVKVGKREGTPLDMFNITKKGREALMTTQTYGSPKALSNFSLPRDLEQRSIEEMHMFEQMQLLCSQGCGMLSKPTKSKCDPYVRNGPKILWYISSATWGSLGPAYLTALLKADSLFDRGLPALHDFQVRKYYEAVTSLPSERLAEVRHGQPNAFYELLTSGDLGLFFFTDAKAEDG